MTPGRRRLGVRRPVVVLLAIVALTGACSSDGEDGADATTTIPDQVTPGPVVTEARTPPRWSIDAALAADPDCATPVAGVPLRIGYAADLSETGSPTEQSATEAALHLVRLINCSGGVDGQPVDVQVVDASGSPVSSRNAVQELLTAGAEAIIGPPTPDPGLRVLQVTAGTVPVVFTSAGDPVLADPTQLSFLAAFDHERSASAAARFAVDQGWSNAVTFSGPGSVFAHNPQVFAEAFQAAGGVLVADYPYVPSETQDFADAAGQLTVGQAPSVIYTAMPADQLALLRAELSAVGLTPEIIVADNFEATGGYSVEGLENVLHTAHVLVGPGSRTATLDESYRRTIGEGFANPTAAALAADAITVILDAYLRSGRATPDGVGAAIAEGIDIQGVTGSMSFGGRGSPIKPVYINRVVGGQPVPAGTIEG